MEDEFITDRDLEAGFERARRAFEDDTTISDRNKELVGRFLRDAALGKTLIGRAKKKIGPSRRTSYLNHLLPLIRFLNMDLDQVTEPDMERFIEALDRDRIHSRTRLCRGGRRTYTFERPYSARYKVDIKVTIKKFYKWLSGELRTYPKLVEWIDTAEPTKHVPALTESEVGQMLDRCTSSRQRALIQVLFDGGFRLGELLNVRLHHVRLRQLDPANPTARCFFIRVPYSKTLPRTVALPMPSSTKWLKQWLEDHPAKPAIQEDGTLTAADTATPLFPFTGNAVRGTLLSLIHI